MGTSSYWEQFIPSRQSRRRLLLGTGSVAVGGLLAACATSRGKSSTQPSSSGTAGQGQPRPGGTLNIFALTNIGDLDISKTGGQGSSITSNHAISRLVRFKVG